MNKTYYIRYYPVSSPSVLDPLNWGMVSIQVDNAKDKTQALAHIPESYQRGTLQVCEDAE